MDQAPLFSRSVLQELCKTNPPPTDEERVVFQESVALTDAEPKAVEAQITEAMAHTLGQELNTDSRIPETQVKLQRLRHEEVVPLETSAGHHRVLSSMQDLPQDVICEIFMSCVNSERYPPELAYDKAPSPYALAQISSGMRYVALTTPAIWASMSIWVTRSQDDDPLLSALDYSQLADRASEWFKRAGGMALTVFITDKTYYSPTVPQSIRSNYSDPSKILFDTIFRYSARWKKIHFDSNCKDVSYPPLTRFAALITSDIPLLGSLSLRLDSGISTLQNSPILSTLKLRRLVLDTHWNCNPERANISEFNVNWADLTAVTIRGGRHKYISSFDEIVNMLRKTKHLIFCNVALGPGSEHSRGEINLLVLETLLVDDYIPELASSRSLSIFDLINAPVLVKLEIRAILPDMSLTNFFDRSPGIRELTLSGLKLDETLADITQLLHRCPYLSVLTLKPRDVLNFDSDTVDEPFDANSFLRAFVEDTGAGVICPRLQNFSYTGSINFSSQTLRQFLEAKEYWDDSASSLLPWKRVFIGSEFVDNSEVGQIHDLVSQKQAAGLDIDVYV